MTEGIRPSFTSARVLVVDDEAQSTALLTRMLHHHGYADVHGLTDPSAALEAFHALAPDLVILDAHMPVVDGFALLEAIARTVPPGSYLPILMLTADGSAETRLRALDLGANDFLTKPFDMVEAVYRIRNLLHTRKLHLELEAERSKLAARVRERTKALEAAHAGTLARLAQAAELRDDDTGQHTQRVGTIAVRIAQELGLESETVRLIGQAAPLHDLGKIGVPDSILLKPGPLTEEEWVVMRGHTSMGASILAEGGSELIEMAEQIALSHHERWDGTGYPRQLRGEEIPVVARVVAVADFFDAVSHARPYRGAWPLHQALEAIREGAGSHFDSRVVEAFCSADAAGPFPNEI